MPASSTYCRRTYWKQLGWWTVLCGLFGFAAMAAPFYGGCYYIADDLLAYHLPLRQFYANCLSEGASFLWWPAIYCGHYVHGEGQGGFFHPLHLLLYRWLPLRSAMGIEVLINYPLLITGMSIFLRRHLPWAAAVFGAVVFGFSGFALLHFMHLNAIAVVAQIPWLLTTIDIRLRTNNRRVAAGCDLGIALLTASQLLLGYPQYVWMSLLVEAGYVAWFTVQYKLDYNALIAIALSKLLGFLLGAVQLLPSYEALSEATRNTTPDFSNQGSLHPLNLVQFVAPYLFRSRVVGGNTHELGLYAGTVPLLLAVWYIFSAKPPRRSPIGKAALGLFIVAMLLAFGTYGLIYQFQTWLPVIGSFRFPSRYIVLVHLAIAVLASLGLTELWRTARKHHVRCSTSIPASILLVLTITIAIPVAALLLARPTHLANPLLILLGPCLFLAGGLLLLAAMRGWRPAFPLLIAFAIADLLGYGLSYAIYPHVAPLPQLRAQLPQTPHATHSSVVLPPPAEQMDRRVGNAILLAGYRRIDGYSGLEPARQLDYRDEAALAVAGAEWLRTPPELVDSQPTWKAITGSQPRARLVSRATLSMHPAVDLPQLDLANGALVTTPPPLLNGGAGTATVRRDRPGQIELVTTAPGQQLLVLTERYHCGWTATIDRAPCTAERINGDFLGCFVPAGTHEVVFRFSPWSFRWGVYISSIAVGLVLGRFAFGLKTDRPTN